MVADCLGSNISRPKRYFCQLLVLYYSTFELTFNRWFLEIHAATFPRNRDIALTVWNLFSLLGMTWQTAWSTSVCVYLKIFIQMGFLTFCFICYGKPDMFGKSI